MRIYNSLQVNHKTQLNLGISLLSEVKTISKIITYTMAHKQSIPGKNTLWQHGTIKVGIKMITYMI